MDLSGLAPEYLYPLVDAYDRPVQDEGQDRVAGLEAIRGRLVPVFEAGAGGSGSQGRVRWPWLGVRPRR